MLKRKGDSQNKAGLRAVPPLPRKLTLDEVLALRPPGTPRRLTPEPEEREPRVFVLGSATVEEVDTVTPRGRGRRLDLVADGLRVETDDE